MKKVLLQLIAALVSCLSLLGARKPKVLEFANIAEGTHGSCGTTRLTDAAITTSYLLAKIGSDAGHVDAGGASDIPVGVICDEASAAELPVNVKFFGETEGSLKVVASAAIAQGALVVPAASGKVKTLPGAAGTYYIVGRAKEAAAADGDEVEISPCLPVQRVVA